MDTVGTVVPGRDKTTFPAGAGALFHGWTTAPTPPVLATPRGRVRVHVRALVSGATVLSAFMAPRADTVADLRDAAVRGAAYDGRYPANHFVMVNERVLVGDDLDLTLEQAGIARVDGNGVARLTDAVVYLMDKRHLPPHLGGPGAGSTDPGYSRRASAATRVSRATVGTRATGRVSLASWRI